MPPDQIEVSQLLTIPELWEKPDVRRLVGSEETLRRMLAHRERNGLKGAAHLSPNGRLLVNYAKFVRWLYGIKNPKRVA